MADTHDNIATVVLGGEEYKLCASKRAERIYGDRFRSDVAALGTSGVIRQERDKDGKPVGEPYQVAYSGRLKLDIAVSAAAPVGPTADIPDQVVAAAWALARAAGSTEKSYDEWLVWWWTLPCDAGEDLDLYEAVCVDLAERAFFRHLGGRNHAQESDEGETE